MQNAAVCVPEIVRKVSLSRVVIVGKPLSRVTIVKNCRFGSTELHLGHQSALQTLATMCAAEEVKVGCGKKRKWLLFKPNQLQKLAL